jgi:signal peptidase II
MIVRLSMTLGESIPVIGNLIKLTYVENPGIAFGIRVGDGTLFTVLSIIACIGVVVYLVTHWDESMGMKAGLALILGGACGNLIDRVVYGQVVDFIDIGIRTFRWPVFNVADSAVVIGMVVFFFSVSVQPKHHPETTGEELGETG